MPLLVDKEGRMNEPAKRARASASEPRASKGKASDNQLQSVTTASIPTPITPSPRQDAAVPVYSSQPQGMSSSSGGTPGVAGTDAISGLFGNRGNRSDRDRANESYLQHFSSLGMSDDDVYGLTHRQTRAEYQPNPASPQDLINVGNVGSPVDTSTTLDDGTLDYDHLISDNMTGTQYLRYADLGMGGRPSELIDPSEIYSKQSEMRNYEFQPFTPDLTASANMLIDDLLDKPSQLATSFGQSRTNGNLLTGSNDYTIHLGDRDVSGTDFDRRSPAYMHQYDYYSKFEPERYLRPPADGSSYTPVLVERVIPDAEGNDTYHYGEMSDIRQLYLVSMGDGSTYTGTWEDIQPLTYEDENGNYVFDPASGVSDISPTTTSLVSFTDGSSVETSNDFIESIMRTDESGYPILDPEDIPMVEVTPETARGVLPDDLESLNDIAEISAAAAESGDSPLNHANVVFVPDMMMSDGTSLPYTDVRRMRFDDEAGDDPNDASDDDISYDFASESASPFGLVNATPIGVLGRMVPQLRLSNKPRRLMGQELFTEDGVNLDDLGNNLYDWTLGSIPISIPGVVPYIEGLSSATSSLHGIDPQSYNPATGSYKLLSGAYDDEGNLRYGLQPNGEMSDSAESAKRWNALGNMTIPLTENLAGNIGSDPFKAGVERILGRSLLPDNPTLMQLLGNTAFDAAGEAIEEVIGNPVEEATRYGGSRFYADQVMDDQGNPMYDLYGNEIRDVSTPYGKRLENALDRDDILNAAAGGAGVSAFMNLLDPFGAVDLAKAARRDSVRRANGIEQFRNPSPDLVGRHVSRDYARSFSDRIDEE